ncbi:MAG TPA: ATP-binding protein [Candidatus Eremiobacteraeota bacterium]|nr:ATP-binding protein [Candidatus Eremiobacteraeota bacterium]
MEIDRSLFALWENSWSKENKDNKIIYNPNRFFDRFLYALEHNDDLIAFEEGAVMARDVSLKEFKPLEIIEAWKILKNSFMKIIHKENLELIDTIEKFFNSSQTGFLEELLKRQTLELEDAREREKELTTRSEVAEYELSIALSRKVTLQEAMNLTLDTVIRLIGAERASIMLWDLAEEVLVVKAAKGMDALPFGVSKIKSGTGIAGWAFEQGKVCVVNDVREDSRFIKSPSNQEEIKSIICLPLIVEDQKIGVINVGTLSRYHTFTRDEIKTLELIASRAALAIDNVILHENEKKYIEILKEKTDKLNAIVRDMGDGVLIFDKHGNITSFNRAAEYIMNITEEHVQGKEWISVMSLLDDHGNKVSIEPSFTFKKSKGFLSISAEESKFVSATATPLLNPQGEKIGGIVVFSDMSKEKEIEKMKSEFVSIVSHDLRSPLTSVKGYASMILHYNDRLNSDKKKEFLEIIIREVERLVRLIKSLLDLAKIESGRFECQKIKFDIIPLIKNVIDTYRSSENHTINMNIPEGFPVIIGDPDQLEQVLHNLVANAIKYSPDGGEVEVGGEIEDNKAIIYVRDHGMGIPEDEVEGVFEKFHRVKTGRKIVGAGLGLFITKNIIDAHGGRIWVESSHGQGSKFVFSLNLS